MTPLQQDLALLLQRGFTLAEVARELKCSAGHAHDLKSGRRTGLSHEQGKALEKLVQRARRRKVRA